MNIKTLFKRSLASALVALAAVVAMTSCSGVIYDDEGDCDVVYRLRFRYDMNMKFADAFPHEVTSVHLYAFTPDGKLVWQTTESGPRLAEEGYDIVLPLEAGQYRLAAWCGLDNGESFTVPEISAGDAHSDIHCRLNRSYDEDGNAISTDDLHRLFHGTLDVDLPVNDDGGEYTYTMPLVKDTNIFRVVLQHLSGKDIDVNDFTFRIEDSNGWLHHDNSLRPDEPVTYHAWSTYSGSAGVDVNTGRAITEVSVAVAELTVSRLVMRDWSKESKPVLVIRKADSGDLVARVPIIDYALLVKGNYNRQMSDQEYLDRQDEYNMTFFLDENQHWLSTVVIINSWRVVLNPTDLD